MSTKSVLNEAYFRALETLKDRYTDKGIYAGRKHFSDIWLRDSCYAAMGSLSVGDSAIVRANLVTMLTFQSETGQIPLRVGQKSFLLKYLGIDAKELKARFTEDKGVSVPTDSNSLFLIIVEKYLKLSQDKAFAVQYFDRIKKAIEWNFLQDINHDTLIEEGFYSGWADSLKKSGTVLYTNVLHYKAVQSFCFLCEYLGKTSDAKHYSYLAACVHAALNRLFWNGEYFIDWIDSKDCRYDYFSTDGNVFAIVFRVASHEQAVSIQNYIQRNQMDAGFSTRTVHPSYENAQIYSLFHLIHIQDYHNGLQWLWIGCVDAVSKYMIGMKKEARELLTRIAEKIVEHGGVYEVYDRGNPVRRMFYKSENWFAWSAGMFVWACHELGVVPKS